MAEQMRLTLSPEKSDHPRRRRLLPARVPHQARPRRTAGKHVAYTFPSVGATFGSGEDGGRGGRCATGRRGGSVGPAAFQSSHSRCSHSEDSTHPYPGGDTTLGYVGRFQNLPICGQVYRTFIERNVRTPYVRGEGQLLPGGGVVFVSGDSDSHHSQGMGGHTVVVSGPARGDQLPALLADASYTYTKELAETVFAREPAPGDLLLFNDRAVLPLHSPHPSGRRQTLAGCCLARVAAQPSPSSATRRALSALRGHPDPGALVHTRAGGGAVRDMYTGLPSLSMWFGTLFTVVAFV